MMQQESDMDTDVVIIATNDQGFLLPPSGTSRADILCYFSPVTEDK
jgi:hypothetical protein